MKYKVRFHLGRGPHYQKWQIKQGTSLVGYADQTETLLLVGCKLKNRATASRKIFEGANKTVCAWIECDSVAVIQATDSAWAVMDRANYYQFNPKHYPAWLNDHSEESDDKEIGIIVIDSGTIIEANELTTEDIKIEKVFKC